jgi:uncharacterized protein (TIGR03067 family)
MATLLVGAALVGGVRGDDAANDAKKLEGTWRPVAAELSSKKLPEAGYKAMTLVLKDGRYSYKFGDENDAGTYTVDPAKKPKAMDVTGSEGPNKGRTIPAIYELTGDTLKICYSLDGKTRPTAFVTKPDSKLFMVTYKREKR